MIYLYSGTPGSGKSLHVASKIYYWLRLNKPCICNFYINTSLIYKRGPRKKKMLPFYLVENDAMTPDLLIEISRKYFQRNHKAVKEGSLLLVIDECQLMFNSREWQKSGRAEWLSFFTQHRKYGYDIILIAQFDRMIDRQIRSLIEYEYVHRKVSNYGWKGKIFSVVAAGKLFVCVKVWYPMSEKVGSEFFKAHAKYYKLYDTFGDFGTGNRLTEAQTATG